MHPREIKNIPVGVEYKIKFSLMNSAVLLAVRMEDNNSATDAENDLIGDKVLLISHIFIATYQMMK